MKVKSKRKTTDKHYGICLVDSVSVVVVVVVVVVVRLMIANKRQPSSTMQSYRNICPSLYRFFPLGYLTQSIIKKFQVLRRNIAIVLLDVPSSNPGSFLHFFDLVISHSCERNLLL